MYLLKAMVSSAETHTRIVLTGSSMLTFLQLLRKISPNGYQMFDTAKFVLLAQPAPSDAWALRMVQDIKRARIDASSQINAALSSALSKVDDVDVLNIIRQHPDWINIRPAIIDQLLTFSQNSLDDGMKVVIQKMRMETGRDFQLATHSLRDDYYILKPMRQLAVGTVKASQLLPTRPMEAKFLAYLCGLNEFKPDDENQVVRLVPPYAALCEKRITEQGIVRANDDEFFRPGELEASYQFTRDFVRGMP
jgi:hypothetical protein